LIEKVDTQDTSANTSVVTYSVMFYYSIKFAEITLDIPGYVDQLLAETNQGLANSEVSLEVAIA
jgi:hypothetical protein